MKLTRDLYKSFRQNIGAELKKQRLALNWSLEQATQEFNLGNPQVLERIERGASKRFFLIFALIGSYGCKLEIRLTKQ